MDYNVEEDYFTCYNKEKLNYQETKFVGIKKRKIMLLNVNITIKMPV